MRHSSSETARRPRFALVALSCSRMRAARLVKSALADAIVCPGAAGRAGAAPGCRAACAGTQDPFVRAGAARDERRDDAAIDGALVEQALALLQEAEHAGRNHADDRERLSSRWMARPTTPGPTRAPSATTRRSQGQRATRRARSPRSPSSVPLAARAERVEQAGRHEDRQTARGRSPPVITVM